MDYANSTEFAEDPRMAERLHRQAEKSARYLWARRGGAQVVDADDLVQDAYLKALEKWKDDDRRHHGWMASFCEKTMRSAAYAQSNHPERTEVSLVDEQVVPDESFVTGPPPIIHNPEWPKLPCQVRLAGLLPTCWGFSPTQAAALTDLEVSYIAEDVIPAVMNADVHRLGVPANPTLLERYTVFWHGDHDLVVPLRSAKAASLIEVRDQVSARVRGAPSTSWIVGSDMTYELFTERKVQPRREKVRSIRFNYSVHEAFERARQQIKDPPNKRLLRGRVLYYALTTQKALEKVTARLRANSGAFIREAPGKLGEVDMEFPDQQVCESTFARMVALQQNFSSRPGEIWQYHIANIVFHLFATGELKVPLAKLKGPKR